MNKVFFAMCMMIGALCLVGCQDNSIEKDRTEEEPESNAILNGHEYVDLGLSVNWATTNVSLATTDVCGSYFSWGELYPKQAYDWNQYSLCDSLQRLKKYCNDSTLGTYDGVMSLLLEDDAAYKLWGKGWRMPKESEWRELMDTTKCKWTWSKQNGIQGYKITSRKNSGKSIFLPVAGIYENEQMNSRGVRGCYWSASLSYGYNESGACYMAAYMELGENTVDVKNMDRCYGLSVRAVTDKNKDYNTEKDMGEGDGGGTTPTGVIDGHEYVDLGLKVKWASCNMGAQKPEDCGSYYAWGETNPKVVYTWATYKYCAGKYNALTKYSYDANYGCLDNLDSLEMMDDDAAFQNWQGRWRMPSVADWTELRDSCTWTWTWTLRNYVYGCKVTSKKNGNSIFLPATGYIDGKTTTGEEKYGNYWSSNLGANKPDEAVGVYFNSAYHGIGNSSRYLGFTIRPVYK